MQYCLSHTIHLYLEVNFGEKVGYKKQKVETDDTCITIGNEVSRLRLSEHLDHEMVTNVCTFNLASIGEESTLIGQNLPNDRSTAKEYSYFELLLLVPSLVPKSDHIVVVSIENSYKVRTSIVGGVDETRKR